MNCDTQCCLRRNKFPIRSIIVICLDCIISSGPIASPVRGREPFFYTIGSTRPLLRWGERDDRSQWAPYPSSETKVIRTSPFGSVFSKLKVRTRSNYFMLCNLHVNFFFFNHYCFFSKIINSDLKQKDLGICLQGLHTKNIRSCLGRKIPGDDNHQNKANGEFIPFHI